MQRLSVLWSLRDDVSPFQDLTFQPYSVSGGVLLNPFFHSTMPDGVLLNPFFHSTMSGGVLLNPFFHSRDHFGKKRDTILPSKNFLVNFVTRF